MTARVLDEGERNSGGSSDLEASILDSPEASSARKNAQSTVHRSVGWQSRPSITHSCLHMTYDNTVAVVTGKCGIDPLELIW